MEIISGFDIAIVGGGAAGLRAAIAAAEANPKAKIAVISKVYPVRSHTVAAEGGAAAALLPDDSPEIHARDTIVGADYLADQDAVEYFTKKCAEEILTLDRWGCPWSRDEKGQVHVRPFGGMNRQRTAHAADKTGFFIMHTLFERTLLHENIKRFDEWFVTRLFRGGQRVNGLFAIDLKRGVFTAIEAKVIIIATGGAGQIYRHTTNASVCTGDGIALALNEGASLKDMEFVQFHPTSLPKTGMLITEAARGEGGYLLNGNNERFLRDYIPDSMEMGPRDIVSRAIVSEIKAGRAADTPCGKCMYLDLRHLGKKTIMRKLPQLRELTLTYLNLDPAEKPIPVTPAQHYLMGGISANIDCETDVPGLLAVGESACTSVNGANRLGSNSLSKCLVFGSNAGKTAVRLIAGATRAPLEKNLIKEEKSRLEKIIRREGKETPDDIASAMKETMEEGAGIIRNKKGLQKASQTIRSLQDRIGRTGVTQKNHVFNLEFLNLLELENMLDLSACILASALAREESRGAHYREDFPERDDENFLLHHHINKENGSLKITRRPVKITAWPPGKRNY